MAHDLAAALCLVMVIEGLVLFTSPRGWQNLAREALKMEPQRLRICGAVVMAAGLLFLQLVH